MTIKVIRQAIRCCHYCEVYKNHNSKIQEELFKKKLALDNLNDYLKDISDYIEFGLYLMRYLELFFKQAGTLVKIG